MKAIMIEKPWEVGSIDRERPRAKPGEALIKVCAAGICGSDIGAYRGTNGLVSYPRIIGHEIAGEIITAPDDSGYESGDRVVADPYLYCGKCYPCSIGRTNCCTSLNVLGVHIDGGMAEYIAHPAHMLHRIPDAIPWELAPLSEPLTIALHGLHRMKLASGEHVAIFGAGPIGLLAAMAAIHYGAAPIVIDIESKRLEEALGLGVKQVINSETEDLPGKISEFTDGKMCECVMEASGASSAIRSTLDIVSHAGRIALTGWPKEEISLPTEVITRKEIDIRGARNSAGEFKEALDLIATGSVDVKAVLTQTAGPDDAPAMIRDIDKNPGSYLKVNILFNES